MRPTAPLFPWYAVARGFVPGVYNVWREAWRSARTFPNSHLRTFPQRPHAEKWILDMWLKEALLTVQPSRHDLNFSLRSSNQNKLLKKERARLEFWGHDVPGKKWTREEIIEEVTERWERMKRRDEERVQAALRTEERNVARDLGRIEKEKTERGKTAEKEKMTEKSVTNNAGETMVIRRSFFRDGGSNRSEARDGSRNDRRSWAIDEGEDSGREKEFLRQPKQIGSRGKEHSSPRLDRQTWKNPVAEPQMRPPWIRDKAEFENDDQGTAGSREQKPRLRSSLPNDEPLKIIRKAVYKDSKSRTPPQRDQAADQERGRNESRKYGGHKEGSTPKSVWD